MKKTQLLPLLFICASSLVHADAHDEILPSMEEIFEGSASCANEIANEARDFVSNGEPGTYTLSSIPYADIDINQVGTATWTNSRSVSMLYVESTYHDGGSDGSAWRNCMTQKGLPTPE